LKISATNTHSNKKNAPAREHLLQLIERSQLSW
jgi:hypothetical protein